MRKHFLLSALILTAVVIAVGATACLAWHDCGGKVTIPNGEPVVGIYVTLHNANCVPIGWDITDHLGRWFYTFDDCNMFVTACVFTCRIKTTECVTELIDCNDFTWFDDIVLECGGPKQPPCPRQ